jgi:hypothetical protein
MENVPTAIEVFFRRFETNNSKSDFSEAVSQFADTFMAAGPQGAQCVRAGDFALALPKRKQLFESYGCQPMQLVSVDTHALGDRYAMAHTRWKMNFANSDSEAMIVESTFVVDTAEQPFRIVLYLAHQDILAMLKERASAKA